jgi:hypothetical protein
VRQVRGGIICDQAQILVRVRDHKVTFQPQLLQRVAVTTREVRDGGDRGGRLDRAPQCGTGVGS